MIYKVRLRGSGVVVYKKTLAGWFYYSKKDKKWNRSIYDSFRSSETRKFLPGSLLILEMYVDK